MGLGCRLSGKGGFLGVAAAYLAAAARVRWWGSFPTVGKTFSNGVFRRRTQEKKAALPAAGASLATLARSKEGRGGRRMVEGGLF